MSAIGAVRRQFVARGDRIGLNNRMRLAKLLNSVTAGRRQAWRVAAYERLKNGELGRHRDLRLEDGFTHYRTLALPVMSEMLAAGVAVVHETERRGSDELASLKVHMNNRLAREHLYRHAAFIEFGTSAAVVSAVADYLGCIPVLSSVKVLVSRPTGHGKLTSSQLFHRDHADFRQVKIFVYLTDVDREAGPFSFLPASASERAASALKYGQIGSAYRVPDEVMTRVPGTMEYLEIAVGPAGTALFVDTSRCFHYGGRNTTRERWMVMYQYITGIRSDFRAASYAELVPQGANELVQAVLDPSYHGC